MSQQSGALTKDAEQSFYICGQCGDKQHYLKSDAPDVPCPDCGWVHLSRKKYNVPAVIKLNLGNY